MCMGLNRYRMGIGESHFAEAPLLKIYGYVALDIHGPLFTERRRRTGIGIPIINLVRPSKAYNGNPHNKTVSSLWMEAMKNISVKMICNVLTKVLLSRAMCTLVTCAHNTIRCILVRSCKGSKPRDLCLELYDRSEIWQAHRHQYCRCACQISKRCDNFKAMRLWDYMRSYDKMSYRLLKRVPGKAPFTQGPELRATFERPKIWPGRSTVA